MKLGRKIAALAVAFAVSCGLPALAEDWAPSGNLTLQIGFGAGGSTDTIGRVLAQVMEEQTGWNIIVENKAGGGGVAMFTGIANRPPRGQIIGMGVNMPILVNLVNRGDALGFDVNSFDYLATVADTPIVVVARSDAPYDDIAGLLEHAKTNGPVKAAFGAPPQKLVLDAATRTTGAEFTAVSTKGGSEGMQLVLGGQVDIGFSSGEHFPFEEAGDMKVIGTTAPERIKWAPDAQTFVENGVNAYANPIFYIATTAGTDPSAVKALTEAIDAALQTDEVAKVVQNAIKNDPLNRGPEGTKQMMVDGIDNVRVLFQK